MDGKLICLGGNNEDCICNIEKVRRVQESQGVCKEIGLCGKMNQGREI